MNVLRLKVTKRREKWYFYLNNRSVIGIRMVQMVESREITLGKKMKEELCGRTKNISRKEEENLKKTST